MRLMTQFVAPNGEWRILLQLEISCPIFWSYGYTHEQVGLEGMGSSKGEILCLVGHSQWTLEGRSLEEKRMEQLRPLPALQANSRDVGPSILPLPLHQEALGACQGLAWAPIY
jgi:hypothetical protein